MAEIVSSAIAQETVSQILSGLVKRYENKDNSHKNEDLERLEMAHLKLEAALEASNKWQITDASLLRWRKKLKRAAKECDGTLHKCKQRIIEEEQMEKAVRESSFPKRIVHTTRSYVFSIFNHNNDESTRSIVQRFEWYADGASDFLRFLVLDLGGTPRCQMPFDPLIMHLLEGKKLQHRMVRANECLFFLQWTPFTTAEYGIEASLIFMRKDGNEPQNDFFLSIMLQLSESTDIVGIAIKCLQLFAPLFKSRVETIRKELMQLPTGDFSWVPHVDSDQKKHWDNHHRFGTQWFRPNPLCCKQHELLSCSMGHMSELPDSSLEPVIGVNLQCRVSPSEYNRQTTALPKGSISLQNTPQIKAVVLFVPHGSSEDLVPGNVSSATQVINGGEQHCLLTNITLEQLEEIMLPKAVDYFLQNIEASGYQMLWKSKHGAAYFQVMNTSMNNNQRRRRMIQGARKGKLRRENQGLERQTHVIPQYFDLMVAHAPVRMQGSILDWIRKERENQLAPPPLWRQFWITEERNGKYCKLDLGTR